MKNGTSILEAIISSFNGVCNPIRCYSAEELNKATSDFQWEIQQDSSYSFYKGIYEEREIAVKTFKPFAKDPLERISNEVAIASRMSNHNNVLKLIGYCLETELPMLVYESSGKGNLNQIYEDEEQLTWESKLRIATEIANALSYLHCGLPNTIIHRAIKPGNVLLDRNDVAKLFEFQMSALIPDGENHVDIFDGFGTPGFHAPEGFMNHRYTEKSDVYGFGFLLFGVLTGKERYDIIKLGSDDQSGDSHEEKLLKLCKAKL